MLVLDRNADPVEKALVRFAASVGSITPEDTTGTDGIAEAIFIAPRQAGNARIYAMLGAKTDSLEIRVDATSLQSLVLLADSTSILADGMTPVGLRIVLQDSAGRPANATNITLTATAGTVTPAVMTDDQGQAVATYIPPASSTDLKVTIQARANPSDAFVQLDLRGVSFSVDVQPGSLIADGRSQATVQAVIKESSNFVAVPGAKVRFGTTLGTIAESAISNSSGVAEAVLTSATVTGVAMVVAHFGPSFRDTVHVVMGESVPTYLSLSAEPTVLVADNASTATIRASVTDAANNPVPDGTPVNFSIVSGSGTIESQKFTHSGIASSTLVSGNRPDSVLVRAAVVELADTVLVQYVVGAPAQLSLVADSSSLPADGITTTDVRAFVMDKSGNPVVDGTLVHFAADFGEITPTAETVAGVALATYSSSRTGLARLTATVGDLSASTSLRLRPGAPNSIVLRYDPVSLGVKDSGRNTTLTVTAHVRDAKNNPVTDGVLVAFSIVASPGGGEFLSTTLPVPTLNGQAQVSLNAGIRSGTVRISASVVDSTGQPIQPTVSAVSTDVIIFAGPPYIDDVNDPATSRVSVGARPVNIFGWYVVNDTTTIVAVVGDKFNNPVPESTAVYFTTTGGIISTHTGYTNKNGIAVVRLISAQPYPTVPLYYSTFFNPNLDHPEFTGLAEIPGPIPDFEGGVIDNGFDDTSQNNGIARVLAVTEGVDRNGRPARAWGVTNVVFSGSINTFYATVDKTQLLPGEGATIEIVIYDVNGNPIVPGSRISLKATAGELSWTELVTADPGVTRYHAVLVNNLDPTDPDAKETTVSVGIQVTSANGNNVISTEPILLKLQ